MDELNEYVGFNTEKRCYKEVVDGTKYNVRHI